MIKIEGEKGINPSELKLSKTEVDKQAFALMGEFKAQLHNLEEFRQAASDVYLNLSGEEDKNVDAPRREVEKIDMGGSEYRVNYSFSAKEQNLFISRKILNHSEPIEVIILKSKRFTDQKSIGSARIEWYVPAGAARDYPQVNTAFAVQKARGMLNDLSPKA